MRAPFVCFGLLLASAGCDSRADITADDGSGGGAFPSPSSWQVVSVAELSAPASGDQVIGTVHFSGDDVEGIGGCNRYGASYSAQSGGFVGNRIQVMGFSATEAGCDPSLQPFEQAMFAAIVRARSWGTVSDGSLHISGPAGDMVLLPMLTGGAGG